MLKVLKWVGIGLAGLVGLVGVLVLILFFVGRSKAAAAPDVVTREFQVPATADSATLARGAHVAAITGCEDCHGPGLGGKAFPIPAMLVSMAAPNLTKGEGGVGAAYTPADWNRAVRHGIGKDGRRLIVMPSEAYNHLSDQDFAALVAYLQTVAPVNQSFPARKVGFAGGAMLAAGMFPTAVDMIAHDSVGVRPVVPFGVNADYGRYLVNSLGCNVCHGPDLRGGKAGMGPPPAPSLVAFVANNSAEAFRNTIRTGKTPSGRELDPEMMPWTAYRHMTDDELEAVRLYVQHVIANPPPPAK